MRSLLAVLLLVVPLACTSSRSAPAPMRECADGPPVCAMNGSSVGQCQNGRWVTLQGCTAGCTLGPGGFAQCGAAPAPVAAGGAGAPCAAEGGYGCTPDRKALTVCRGGRTAIASTCRGKGGCIDGNAVDCDHSVAMVGDPCESPKEIACSTDSRALLRCTGGVYRESEPCRNACLSTSGRALCQ